MKYLTTISEQELSACLTQTSQSVAAQQKKWRLQVAAFFCALFVLGCMALLETGVLFPELWRAHSRFILVALLTVFVLVIFTSAFVSSHLHSTTSDSKHNQNDTHQIHYNIDLNDEGIQVSTVSEKSQESTHYLWATIKKVYLFSNGIMILGYTKKAKGSLLLPFNDTALYPTMQHLVDEMRLYLPASIFINGHF